MPPSPDFVLIGDSGKDRGMGQGPELLMSWETVSRPGEKGRGVG
jgi:hypothetical protein